MRASASNALAINLLAPVLDEHPERMPQEKRVRWLLLIARSGSAT